jgi:uncharacterized protein with NRDE domain
MCLSVFNHRPGHDWPLLLVANRDEFRDRPTETMHWWAADTAQANPILAGRDQLAGGTWLGVDRTGRLAMLTNIRPGYVGRTGQRSRGELPLAFLRESHSIETFHQIIRPLITDYAGFNLVLFDKQGLFWFSSDHPDGQWLSEGTHALSNDAINTPWPKVSQARDQMVSHHKKLEITPWQPADLTNLPILTDPVTRNDNQLPDTGVPLDWERRLSAQTITGDRYGTRCRTWLALHGSGHIQVAEAQLRSDGSQIEPGVFTWQTSP